MYGKYETEVAVAAPTAPKWGIKIKFKVIFKIVAMNKLIALFFANP